MDLIKEFGDIRAQLATLGNGAGNQALTAERDALKAQLATITGERDTLAKQVADLTSEKTALSTQLASLKDENGKLTAEVEALKKTDESDAEKTLSTLREDALKLATAAQVDDLDGVKAKLAAITDIDTLTLLKQSYEAAAKLAANPSQQTNPRNPGDGVQTLNGEFFDQLRTEYGKKEEGK